MIKEKDESSKIEFKSLSKNLQEEVKYILDDPEILTDLDLEEYEGDMNKIIEIVFNGSKLLYTVMRWIYENTKSDIEMEEKDNENTSNLKKMEKETEKILKKLK